MNKFLLILISSLFAFTSDAKIIDIKQMSEMPQHVTSDTLIIFDIDNTILEPAQEFGNDQWFYHHYEKIKADKTHPMTLDDLLAYWHKIMIMTEMNLVETSTPEFVKELQKQHQAPIIALTTRSFEISQPTLRQLKKHGIEFESSAPSKAPIFFVQGEKYIFFDRGVLFSNGGNKGKALFHLLDTIRYKPKRILFINDKASHLKDVESASEERNIEFIGLRYGYLDDKVSNFQKEIADIQEKHFKPIISDDEARRLRSCR